MKFDEALKVSEVLHLLTPSFYVPRIRCRVEQQVFIAFYPYKYRRHTPEFSPLALKIFDFYNDREVTFQPHREFLLQREDWEPFDV